MAKKIVRTWKKVFENDLPYVVSELKETLEKPSVLILTGEMGSGKTTFSKAFIGGKGVQSPTYSIISETPLVVHADFYRIKDKEEMIQLELPLYLEGKDYFLVEWGKNFLTSLDKEIDERFIFYELSIEIQQGQGPYSSRNYTLRSLERS